MPRTTDQNLRMLLHCRVLNTTIQSRRPQRRNQILPWQEEIVRGARKRLWDVATEQGLGSKQGSSRSGGDGVRFDELPNPNHINVRKYKQGTEEFPRFKNSLLVPPFWSGPINIRFSFSNQRNLFRILPKLEAFYYCSASIAAIALMHYSMQKMYYG